MIFLQAFTATATVAATATVVLLQKTRSSFRSIIPLSQIAVAWFLSMNIACCHQQHQARKGILKHHTGEEGTRMKARLQTDDCTNGRRLPFHLLLLLFCLVFS
jgi:Na+/H+ antiporter NhaC